MKFIIDYTTKDIAIHPIILEDIRSIVVTDDAIEIEYLGEGTEILNHNRNRDRLSEQMIEFITTDKTNLAIS